MIPILISMLLFAFIGAVSPGPVNVIATGAGANFGFIRALPYVFGATVAYTLIVFLVGIGLNQLLQTYPRITDSLRYFGGTFLLYMSYKLATTGAMSKEKQANKQPPTFTEGALSQWLNPKAWLVSMSGVSLFVATNSPTSLYLAAFCLISFFACFTGVGTWAVAGHLIHKLLSQRKHQIAFSITMGLLLAGSVISMLFIQ
ncbi:LysE family translocator [Parendozoicomonas sp. Alg238-R29]|uniref:LysE family translocator n=1 Tax=Parendozoicomonas sp. Alg238-R29 TaxID=2993446 RepID=UPI00248D9BAE|nr:LysE family translocator [Parendozoicomonas sp. Alg238-R29]